MDESSDRAMARNLNKRITGILGVPLKVKRDGRPPQSAFAKNQFVPRLQTV